MSTASFAPNLGYSACGDPFCVLDICTGPDSHLKEKPWYMTQAPLSDPTNEAPDPIELLKMDGWVLEKYTEDDKESTLYQYCPSTQWKKSLDVTEIRQGYCNDCIETIPEEMVAAYTMHNWNMLQKYDADMKKYGSQPYEQVEVDSGIRVFR